MKKEIRRDLTLLVCTVFLLTCGMAFYAETELYGNIQHVQRKTKESAIFTESEIQAAMNTAIAHFRAEFGGCRLLEMVYDEEKSRRQAEACAQQYSAEQAIVLYSTFTVQSENAWKEGLMPGETYKNWCWILVRNGNDAWKLKTWGYG